ncbi:MAG TPA: MerR family DNA-binding protein [Thermoanaerobaculia bacterium]|nr:MerR family DNA-binding protein [Thermoanaerobaculia bacterium]
MTIGEVAKASGVGVETVRFYERKRLIPQPRRPTAGRRQYDEEIARRIRFIRRAQDLGFSLTEVKQLLDLRLDARRSCSEVKAEAEAKIAAIDARIASLRKMRKSLRSLASSCSGEGSTSACPILDVIESDERNRA